MASFVAVRRYAFLVTALALIFLGLWAGSQAHDHFSRLDNEVARLRHTTAWECRRLEYVVRRVDRNSYANWLTSTALLKLQGQRETLVRRIYDARSLLAFVAPVDCALTLKHPPAKFKPPEPLTFDQLPTPFVLQLLRQPFEQ